MKTIDDKIIDITNDVKWIGVLDYDIKTFDIVMHTDFGTTYNSYFINSEKKALIEVAKEKFSDIYFSKLKRLTDPAEIEYIILDHTEPDHSGTLRLLLEIAPEATVVGSGNAIRYLADIVNKPFKSLIVKDGDTLDLGNKTLKFISAPNLHWPDSIYTLLVEDKVLFTCDSFGAHYCSEELFSDFTSDDYQFSFKYYFDVILKPFSRFMLKAIESILPYDIDMIAPGHGPVHSDNASLAIELSQKYAREYMEITGQKEVRKLLLAYVSAYGYTREAAEIISEGICETEGIEVDITDIETIAAEKLEEKIIESDGILVGSPTINQNTLLPVYTLFALINPLRDRGKLAGAFGSFGWSGEAPKIILENFRLLKLRLYEDTAAFKFAPGGDKVEFLKDFGRNFAVRFMENCDQLYSVSRNKAG